MAGRRKGWESLSEAQRKRYVGKGITRGGYESGVSLDAARGHASKHSKGYIHPPKGVRPNRAALDRLTLGMGDTKDRRAIETWYERDAPAWVKNQNLAPDTAARIFMANLRPENWGRVEIFQQRDGTYVAYVHSKRGGPTRKLELADVESANELGNYIEDYDGYGDEGLDVEWHSTGNRR